MYTWKTCGIAHKPNRDFKEDMYTWQWKYVYVDDCALTAMALRVRGSKSSFSPSGNRWLAMWSSDSSLHCSSPSTTMMALSFRYLHNYMYHGLTLEAWKSCVQANGRHPLQASQSLSFELFAYIAGNHWPATAWAYTLYMYMCLQTLANMNINIYYIATNCKSSPRPNIPHHLTCTCICKAKIYSLLSRRRLSSPSIRAMWLFCR